MCVCVSLSPSLSLTIPLSPSLSLFFLTLSSSLPFYVSLFSLSPSFCFFLSLLFSHSLSLSLSILFFFSFSTDLISRMNVITRELDNEKNNLFDQTDRNEKRIETLVRQNVLLQVRSSRTYIISRVIQVFKNNLYHHFATPVSCFISSFFTTFSSFLSVFFFEEVLK